MKQNKHKNLDLIALLKSQTGEQKLRIAFDLSKFVKKLRKAGENYEGTIKRSGAGRTA
jgi:hypothetical protein